MRIAFMGTPEFSVPVLSALVAAGHDVAAIYTQPPRPAGRGQKLRPSPVQLQAEQYGLTVRTPKNFKDKQDRDAFAALGLDVAVVVAYGLLLPTAILEAPQHGCLNLHASLLPRWRGAAPIHRAIMAGDQQTGIQVMQMEAGLDTGPVLMSEIVPIDASDTTGSLHDKLSMIGAQMMSPALAALERGSLVSTPQDEDGVTYAHKITSEEARIDWSRSAEEIDWHIRGLSPFPGAWFVASLGQGKPVRIKALFSQYIPAGHYAVAPPGTVVKSEGVLVVSTGAGHVALTRLQRPGKAVQEADEFLRGMPIELGTVFS